MAEQELNPAAPAIQHIERAAKILAAHPDHAKQLDVFIDHWGLEHYTPPSEVMESVRRLVMALVILSREPAPPIPHTPA